LKLAIENPIYGVGPGNFPVVAASLGYTAGKQAHSVWMQQLAETGFPGVLALLAFFGMSIVKLWPIARARLTDENRGQIAVASGLVMSIVGFAVAGQFVSLGGLEIPYYSAMIGVVLLRQNAELKGAASPSRSLRPVQTPPARPTLRPAIAMRPRRT
jgi:O-antigen ligase